MFGRKRVSGNKTVVKKTGWTGDEDEEGLIEENPFVFIVAGVVILAVVAVLYYVGIDYDPGWFEGQNLFSTMGSVFLVIFIPAIAISTFTGKSDLVRWEAIFLLIAVFMIWAGNNFDLDKFIEAFGAKIGEIQGINWGMKDIITIVLIAAILIGAYSAAIGKGFGLGSAVVILICIVVLWVLHSGWVPGDSFIGSLLGLPGSEGVAQVPDKMEDAAWGVGIGAGIGAGACLALIATGVGAPIGAAGLLAIILAGGALGGIGGWAGIDFSAIPEFFSNIFSLQIFPVLLKQFGGV